MMMYDQVLYDEHGQGYYSKVEETLAWLQLQIKKHGPFAGVLGFGDGANFAAMLAAQAVAKQGRPLTFVILLSPSEPFYTEQLPELFSSRLEIPALLVWGKKETLQLEEGIEFAVANLFQKVAVATHPDGCQPMPFDGVEQELLSDRIIKFVQSQTSERTHAPPRKLFVRHELMEEASQVYNE